MQRVGLFSLILFIALLAGGHSVQQSTFSYGSYISVLQSAFGLEEEVSTEFSSVLFTGDVLLARRVETLMLAYGAQYPFSNLVPVPEDAYVMGNFEASIPEMHVHTPDLTFAFSVDPQFLSGLTAYGFTHMGTANNHSLDYGRSGYLHTVEELKRHELVPLGDPSALSTSSVSYLTLGVDTVGVIAVNAVEIVPSAESVHTILQEMISNSDFQIVYIHWGAEYASVHHSTQRLIAERFVDAGADAIIGHHPHVVQDIQQYKDALIFYSLGNFIFDQYFSAEVQQGLTVSFTIEEGRPVFTLMPVTSIGSQSAPRPMSEYERDLFLQDMAKKSDTELTEQILLGKITL